MTNLLDKENPSLPLGTVLIGTDPSESPKFQFAQIGKVGLQVFDQQSFFLSPTICIFAVPKDGGGKKLILVELDMVAKDAKNSSNRIKQIFEKALEYMSEFMRRKYSGGFGFKK